MIYLLFVCLLICLLAWVIQKFVDKFWWTLSEGCDVWVARTDWFWWWSGSHVTAALVEISAHRVLLVNNVLFHVDSQRRSDWWVVFLRAVAASFAWLLAWVLVRCGTFTRQQFLLCFTRAVIWSDLLITPVCFVHPSVDRVTGRVSGLFKHPASVISKDISFKTFGYSA